MLTRLEIKNFKSLASTVMNPGRFNVLVGRNGAGKSNVIDALRFISECLTGSIIVPIQTRGGINAVRRKSRGHPTIFGFKIVVSLEDDIWANYAFEIAPLTSGGFEVRREKCQIQSILREESGYELESGRFIQAPPGVRAKIEPDRLALPLLSAVEEYQPLYKFLTSMRFYSFSLEKMRGMQEADPGEILKPDGSNIAAVLRELMRRNPERYESLREMLSNVVPGIHGVEYINIGQKETVRFRQEVAGDEAPWSFDSVSMSDGTLRVLGILLAVNQVTKPHLLAIEEPEVSIHPAAIDVLVDILKGASRKTQVIVTTHSPEILDNSNVEDKDLYIIESIKGNSVVATLSTATRKIIKDKLYLPGELLRNNELIGDVANAQHQSSQLKLFGSTPKIQ